MHFSVAVLLVNWSVAEFGLADVLGAFVASAFLHYTEEAEPSTTMDVEALSGGFLVPTFFAAIGLEMNLRERGGEIRLMAVVLAEMTLVLLGIGLAAGVLPDVMPPLLEAIVFLSALVTSLLLRTGLKPSDEEGLV